MDCEARDTLEPDALKGARPVLRGEEDSNAFLLPDQVVFFPPASPFAIDGKAGVLQAMQTLLANSEHIAWKIINPQFRVIGSTGVTWGHYSFSVKPKDGPLRTEFARFLLAWAKVNGKWVIVAEHNSRLPSGA